MDFNYSKLKGKIRECFQTQEAFALAMGMSKTTLYFKLSNKSGFTNTEMVKSMQLLGLKKRDIDDYFFTLKV